MMFEVDRNSEYRNALDKAKNSALFTYSSDTIAERITCYIEQKPLKVFLETLSSLRWNSTDLDAEVKITFEDVRTLIWNSFRDSRLHQEILNHNLKYFCTEYPCSEENDATKQRLYSVIDLLMKEKADPNDFATRGRYKWRTIFEKTCEKGYFDRAERILTPNIYLGDLKDTEWTFLDIYTACKEKNSYDAGKQLIMKMFELGLGTGAFSNKDGKVIYQKQAFQNISDLCVFLTETYNEWKQGGIRYLIHHNQQTPQEEGGRGDMTGSTNPAPV